MKRLFLMMLVVMSCSASQKKSEPVKMHSPPSDDAVVMPEGPPIVYEETTPVDIAQAPDSETTTVTRARLDDFIAQGPPFALSQVTVEPAKEGDKMLGYRIVEMTPGAVSAIGTQLTNGDIITHINGVKLKTPDDYFEAWKSLHSSKAVRVDFIRASIPSSVVWAIQ